MNVVIKDRKFKVYWMYNSLAIPYLAKTAMGAGKEVIMELSRLPLKKQIVRFHELYPETQLPSDVTSDTTWCFIVEGDKLITMSCVTRYHKDREDRDLARKFSLTKALVSVPELNIREVRKQFWVTYLNRSIKAPVKAPIPMAIV